jgi:hypothetical protein
VKRLFGAVVVPLVMLVAAALLFVGVSYLAVESGSDLRSATANAEQLKAKTRELQDSTRIGNIFVKGWFSQPATSGPVMECAQTLVRGVRSPSVPLTDPLGSLTLCQAALEQLQSEQATLAAPAFTDESPRASQKAMVALYDPPILEVRQTISLIAKWQGMSPKARADAVGSPQEAVRKCLAQSSGVAAQQRQVAASLARSQADDAELNRQIDDGFARVRAKSVRSVTMVALAFGLAVALIVFALWRRARERASSRGGSEGEG